MSYRDWRITVPWTDEQIIAALEEDAALCDTAGSAFLAARARRGAEQVRRGYLSTYLLGRALPFLVKVCTVCGKKALYRIGNEGRCSVHRMVPEKHSRQRFARLDARNRDISERAREFDAFDASRRKLQSAWRNR